MILLFPDPDAFHLALTGGFVPADIASSKAAVAFDGQGRVSVETNGKLPRRAGADLARLGVTSVKRHVGPATPVMCWPQILPAVRDAAPPQLASQAPVLFELEAASDLPILVGEMLRLGNDRQSVRWLDGDAGRVLLRVIGPPYYTLLRALDHTTGGTTGTVRAYVEAAPRVWVQVGYSHPLADKVAIDEGQFLLVRPPRDWVVLPEGPFADVYDVLKFDLPAAPVEWEEAPVREKLAVPLRLVPGNAADAPELWVLHGDAAKQLDGFVRDADDRLTQRLKFAVATGPTGETVVVLRVTAARVAPPVLPLAGAVGFKPYHKLPNLYVPAGTRLHPTLRRDAVRKLLADDTDKLVWLYPGEDGAFTPETLPEDSFRPLEDWVDYVIETNHAPLAAWVEASRFDFEHFVCADGQPPKPKDDGADKGKRPKKSVPDEPAPRDGNEKKQSQTGADRPTTTNLVETPRRLPKSEWEVRRKELETRFLATDGPLDHPDRRALWPELGAANTGYGDTAEAAVCWLNALWAVDPAPLEWVSGWLGTERAGSAVPVTPAEFDRRAQTPEPTAGEAREFAALLVWLSHQAPLPDWFRDRLSAAQKYLEAHERKLPARAVWLAASRLAALAKGDTLGLARVRDRLLQRLLEEGLVAEKDLPRFLRFSELRESDRARLVQEKLTELHTVIRLWTVDTVGPTSALTPGENGATAAYVDLLFAYGFAKLGEAEAAHSAIESARRVLTALNPNDDVGIVPAFLFRAFEHRVRQALTGAPLIGPLPAAMKSELAEMQGRDSHARENPFGMAFFVVSRMLEQSRVLEPQERINPYLKYMGDKDELGRKLFELSGLGDPAALARSVRDLLRGAADRPDVRFHVLVTSLPLAARVGEKFTHELLAFVPDAIAAVNKVNLNGKDRFEKPGLLLEWGMLLAAHYDRRELLQQLIDQFVSLLRTMPDDDRFGLVNVVSRQCLRSLRKHGLRDEIDRLLRVFQDVILSGRPAAEFKTRFAIKPDHWAKALQSLVNLAGGWLMIGLGEQARPILEMARAELLDGRSKLQPKDYVPLAQAYVAALTQGPAETGLPQVGELYRRMPPGKVVNGWTTARFYSRFHLNLVEETVLAVVSDDFARGTAGRRWLEEDELLVRRRIHADMRAHLARSGLAG